MSQRNLTTREPDQRTTERSVPVARIRIDDLPVAEELTPEQEALIQGAGLRSFRPGVEAMETRYVPAPIGPVGMGLDFTAGVLTVPGKLSSNDSHNARVEMNAAGQVQVSSGGNFNTRLTREMVTRIDYQGGPGIDTFTNYTGIKSEFLGQRQGDQHVSFKLDSTQFDDRSANLGARAMVMVDGIAQPTGRLIGANQRPALTWQNAPPGTESWAVVIRDLDAPDGPFSHWVVYNIPANARGLSSDALPGNTLQGLNDSGTLGYFGPNPRVGPRTHRYEITLYALRTRELTPEVTTGPTGATGATEAQLMTAMQNQIIAQTSWVGNYSLPPDQPVIDIV